MNSEEILSMAQAQSEPNDEYERQITRKSISYSTMANVLVCLVMIVAEMLMFKKIDFGKATLICFISAFSDLYEGSKLKMKRRIIVGIIEGILTLGFAFLYIGALLA